jgi:alpha-glucosidase
VSGSVLRAGRLGVAVETAPFALRFSDLETGVDLLGPPAAGRPGDLTGVGFQTTAASGARRWREGPAQWTPGPHDEEPPPAGGWSGAVAVDDLVGTAPGGPLRVRVRTDDPAGRHLLVTVVAAGEGTATITVRVEGPDDDVEAVGAAFAAAPDERWLGFGERSDEVVRCGGVVEHYVGEGTYQDYEYPFLEGTVPPWGIRWRRDATYFPVPWVLSTRGYGVAVDDDDVSHVRLRPDDRPEWTVEVESTRMHLCVVAGPRPLDAVRRYTARVGRQPAPEAPWWYGPWYQTGHANHVPLDEERRQIETLRAAGAPVSAAETHCRYLPLGEHVGHEESERDRTALLHGHGLAVLSYLNPLVGTDYPGTFGPAAGSGALQRRADASPYAFDAYAGGRTPPTTTAAQLDFPRSAALRSWRGVAAQIVDAGYDGWMEDFGEYTPLDAVGPDGVALGPAGHNRYPTDYHAAADTVARDLAAAAGRPLARFARSGWTGTAACTPIVWGGDPTTGWGWNGLASAVVEGLSAGASGVAMWGSDIGGFLSSVEMLTPELLCRWIEFGALTPVMRTKSSGIGPPDHRRPQIWDDDVIAVWRRWAALHTQLNDYLQAAHATYRASGRPIMAAFALVDPDDPAAGDDPVAGDNTDDAGTGHAFYLGEDLVVAPVLGPGRDRRRVTPPAGRWVDLWRAARYDGATRGLELTGGAAAATHDGGRAVDLPAPLDEIPLLVRAGATLVLLPAEVDTLSARRAPGVVSVDDVSHRRLLAFPAPGRWSGATGATTGADSVVDDGTWTLTVTGATCRYDVRADLGLLDDPRRAGPEGPGPVGVEVEGAEDWAYERATGVLSATLTRAELVVRVRSHRHRS